jgi:hypothetical protein
MKIATKLLMLFVSSLMLLAAFTPALALTSPIMAPGMALMSSSNSSYYSTNWSGYAVTGSTGSVTSVSGSWIVPAVTGSTTAYAAFWTGIDGFSSSTVEQTGTISESSSSGAIYYAWYEFYPSPMYQITSVPIKPGDTILASVTYTGSSGSSGRGFFGRSGSKFTVTITDETTGKSYTTTGTVTNAARSSAEWIAEAPSSYRGVLPLANFGTAYYGSYYTSVAGTCSATVSGITGSIGSFGSAVQTITMVTNTGTVKALPSSLSTDGADFTVAWQHS